MSGDRIGVPRGADAPGWTHGLVGRDQEVASLVEFLESTPGSPRSLLLTGQVGVGKSCLLSFAEAHGRSRGMHVLRTVGVETETNRTFSCLQHLLRPVNDRLGTLAEQHQQALTSAFGFSDDPNESFVAGLATLELVSEVATDAPVLVIVDDVQWSDPCSIKALAVMARRLGDDPVWFLAASRDGYEGRLTEADLPELRVDPLDEVSSQVLIDRLLPSADPSRRATILEMSAGNPLALSELSREGAVFGGERVPLTHRIERAFAGRLDELPPRTRSAVLAAAVGDSGSAHEVVEAASNLAGERVALADLAPAAAARLLVIDGPRLEFLHPLVRSAVTQAASPDERTNAHLAWAQVLAGEPDRSVWHRSAATHGTDAALADEFEQLAVRVRRRSSPVTALVALERAAELSADPHQRSVRLLDAAELAFELGRREQVEQLLAAAETLDQRLVTRARATWLRERFDDGLSGGTTSVVDLAQTALETHLAENRPLALNLLAAAGIRCWWSQPTGPERRAVIDVIDQIGFDRDEPLLVAALAWSAALDREEGLIEDLQSVATGPLLDPGAARLYGAAAVCVGDHRLAGRFLDAAVAGFRRDGRVALLAQSLLLRSWNHIHLMRLDDAAADATEGGQLAEESQQPFWAPRANAALALVAGLRGDSERAEDLAAEAERVVFPRGVNSGVADVQAARSATALAHRDYQAAFDHLRRMFDPDAEAFHFVKRCWSIGDLAEAALHVDERDTAIEIYRAVCRDTAGTRSPHIVAAVRHAAAVLADDAHADSVFQEALAAQPRGTSFEHARLQLAYGAWLRRRRRVAESREPLRAALATFDALGAVSWGQQARDELRASGEAAGGRRPDALDHLSPQELQIARLAAEGLSNRDIGQRLYLSPRTIGSHLYRIFPKLDVTSRGQLAAKLDELDLRHED